MRSFANPRGQVRVVERATSRERGRKPFDRSKHEITYVGDEAAARAMNWGTISFPPSERLLLSH